MQKQTSIILVGITCLQLAKQYESKLFSKFANLNFTLEKIIIRLSEGVIMGLIDLNGSDKDFFDRGVKNLIL
jgi:hypothetical protein